MGKRALNKKEKNPVANDRRSRSTLTFYGQYRVRQAYKLSTLGVLSCVDQV